MSLASKQAKPMTTYPVDRYTQEDWPGVCELLGDWAFKPLAGHSAWPAEKLTALCVARAAETLDYALNYSWLVRSPNGVSALTSLTQLPWDSRHLGASAARLDYLLATGSYREQYQVKQVLLAAALKHAAKRKVQHIGVRVNASDLSSLHVLENAGFITVDAILTFVLHLSAESTHNGGSRAKPNGIHLRLATGVDSELAAQLARQAYVYDRFHADPSIPSQRADELHAEWLRNSCGGTAADAVVLAEDRSGLLGFVTCKLQPDTKAHTGKLIGTIVLVATANRARGKGIGRAATLASLDWFRNQQTDIVEVGTQLRNIPATRLYQNCGFQLAGSSVSLRKRY
jgi:RimJ/RimL family protein N-acetyltransferase